MCLLLRRHVCSGAFVRCGVCAHVYDSGIVVCLWVLVYYGSMCV